MTLIADLAASHIRAVYVENAQTLPVSRMRDPNTGKLPPPGEQCRKCWQSWPCVTRQLLDLIEAREAAIISLAAERDELLALRGIDANEETRT